MKRLLSLFAALLCLFIGAVILVTCKKEYSYEGGPQKGSAVFSYLGAGSACANSVVNGSYYTGAVLGDTNTVKLFVDVDSIGTYLVNTNAVNGIIFSGSGSFTDTGVQPIILTGIGTPTAVGTFTFSTPGGDTSCSFTVTVTPKPIIYAAYTLEGDPNACANFVLNGQYVRGQKMASGNNIVLSLNVTSAGFYDITTDTLDGISFSATGTFGTTGTQQVTLLASGTTGDPKNLHFKVTGSNSNCTFDVAVVNPEPLATYVLESGVGPADNPLACIVSGPAGDYTANVPLSGTNTMSIRTTATVAGNFTIATDQVNGMIFSYTGSFAAPGTQFVTLVGSGTPAKAGSFLFAPRIVGPHPIGGETCGFKITVN